MGNYHAGFLGGKGAVTPLTYPVLDLRLLLCLETIGRPENFSIVFVYLNKIGYNSDYQSGTKSIE